MKKLSNDNIVLYCCCCCRHLDGVGGRKVRGMEYKRYKGGGTGHKVREDDDID